MKSKLNSKLPSPQVCCPIIQNYSHPTCSQKGELISNSSGEIHFRKILKLCLIKFKSLKSSHILKMQNMMHSGVRCLLLVLIIWWWWMYLILNFWWWGLINFGANISCTTDAAVKSHRDDQKMQNTSLLLTFNFLHIYIYTTCCILN